MNKTMLMMIPLALLAAPVVATPVAFPCKPGMVITYQGQGQWQEGSGAATVVSRKVTWHTRYLACSHTATKTVAVVRGLPWDLEWYEPGTKPGTYAIIQTPKGLFILAISYRHNLNPATIKKGDGNRILRFPVKESTCARHNREHPYETYCWFLNSVRHQGHKTAWKIVFRTLPDYTSMTIVPGIGMTTFRYKHFGTVAQVRMHLVRIRK